MDTARRTKARITAAGADIPALPGTTAGMGTRPAMGRRSQGEGREKGHIQNRDRTTIHSHHHQAAAKSANCTRVAPVLQVTQTQDFIRLQFKVSRVLSVILGVTLGIILGVTLGVTLTLTVGSF